MSWSSHGNSQVWCRLQYNLITSQFFEVEVYYLGTQWQLAYTSLWFREYCCKRWKFAALAVEPVLLTRVYCMFLSEKIQPLTESCWLLLISRDILQNSRESLAWLADLKSWRISLTISNGHAGTSCAFMNWLGRMSGADLAVRTLNSRSKFRFESSFRHWWEESKMLPYEQARIWALELLWSHALKHGNRGRWKGKPFLTVDRVCRNSFKIWGYPWCQHIGTLKSHSSHSYLSGLNCASNRAKASCLLINLEVTALMRKVSWISSVYKKNIFKCDMLKLSIAQWF